MSKDFMIEIVDPIDPKFIPEPMEELDSIKSFKSAKDLLDFIGKYSADQERDERGRFGSGGGSEKHGGYKLGAIKNKSANETRSAEAVQAARAIRERMAELEPKITRSLIDLANTHGAKMSGLDFRLKSEDSLARKIDAEKDIPSNGGNAQAAAEDMSDVARYTMVVDDKSYASGVQNVLKDLEEKGFSNRVKNYWAEENPYRGVNVAVTDPHGNVFELQFHTEDSLATKEPLHEQYDVYRESKDPIERLALWDSMVSMAGSVPMPPSTGEIAPIKLMPKAIKSDRVAKGREIQDDSVFHYGH